MQKNLLSILFFFLISFLSLQNTLAGDMHFIENRGQWEPEVLYRAEIPGGFLFLKNKSLVYVLYDAARVSAMHGKKATDSQNIRNNAAAGHIIPAHGVEVAFQNASENISYKPERETRIHYNYFLGKEESKWAGNVKAFEEVTYKNVYTGIDLRIYMHQFKLKYEFIVQPNADPAQIKLKYNGAEHISLNETGQIVVKTSVGQFKEAEPYTFQTSNGKQTEVPSHFAVTPDKSIHFVLPKGYDKTKKLTIDPELIFSTYSGSVADNWGHTATYDEEGNLYSGGTVFGTNFPATLGAFQVKFEGLVDVSILKFTPDGSQLVYATFLGGNSTDIPSSLIVNSKNELLVLGLTSSNNFPVRSSAFQATYGGGSSVVPISGLDLPNGSDIFVSKLSASGAQLAASTFLGGKGNDGVSNPTNFTIRNYGDSFRGEIVLDKSDNVLVASSTNSQDFPLKNPVQNKLAGNQDGVVFKLSPELNNLLWSTYIGGDKEDAAYSIKSAVNGDIYVTGNSQSSTLPTSSTSFQQKLSGTEDAFIARFANDKLAGMTYLGTANADAAYLIDLDASSNVYVYGLTNGAYPVSQGVYSNEKSGQFIHALDAALSKTVFSTVIGSGRGTPDISPTAFLVSECGNIYIAGWGGNVNSDTDFNPASSTNNLKVTDDAIKSTTNGNNFYIAILEQGAKSLLYATYFGSSTRTGFIQGDHVDGGTSRFDKNGTIYHATCACGGTHFPVTPQAWSKTNNSENCNNAAFKIDIDRLKADFDVYSGSTKDVVRGCAPLELTFINTSEGGVDYIWDVGESTISREEDQAEYTFKNPGEYTVTLKAYNRLSCKRMDVAQKKIIVETLNTKVMADTAVCENSSVKLFAAGGTQYKWSPAAGMDNAASATPTVNVKENTEFLVEISNASGCKVTEKVKVAVEKKSDFMDMPDTEVCAGSTVVLTVSGDAKQYRWLPTEGLPETIGQTVTVKPEKTTTYTIEGIYADGCRPLREITVKVDRSFEPAFEIAQSGGACNAPFSYSMINNTKNAQKYEWDLGAGNVSGEADIKEYVYETPGDYTVTLTAYNAAGCALSLSKTVTAAPAFTLSNVITPNGDGKNDFFIVPVPASSLEVFNRWGKSVFKAADYKNDWGKGIANGTYFYIVDTPQGNHCKGWVEVLE
ncbi:PKD domain-containing protein [Dyadobacter flavalbus]|uniref:PKD domain-containing protein n=1 Tax=Dyadobacter flavalbus TaxID=2579942 RepID=A0A5M8QI07_9BACT|nr:gliding motility-associated C-terminal domain-containing protein [Dyadobacter flavalbus]KAA6433992.1 PKD domain-containing protein [Dyadobacter flavalbus]